MYVDNEGGAVEVEVQGRDCFIRFPECTDPRHLNEYLNQWETLAAEHGTHLPDEHLQGMLKNMLPQSTRNDVKKWLRDHPGATTANILQYLR